MKHPYRVIFGLITTCVGAFLERLRQTARSRAHRSLHRLRFVRGWPMDRVRLRLPEALAIPLNF